MAENQTWTYRLDLRYQKFPNMNSDLGATIQKSISSNKNIYDKHGLVTNTRV